MRTRLEPSLGGPVARYLLVTMATSESNSGGPGRRAPWVWVVVGLVVVAAAALVLGNLASHSTQPMTEPSTEPTSPSPSPTTQASSSANQAPTQAELNGLATDLGSGEVAQIAPHLGAGTDEVDPAFAANVKELGITIGDEAEAVDLGGGLYEIAAQDKAGNAWAIGLQRSSGQLVIVYAEPA